MAQNGKIFLLDAFGLIYRAYYAMLRTPRMNSKGENTSAIYGFVNMLEEIIRKEDPEYLAVAFDPSGGTFRNELFKEYKAQREETPEDIRFALPIIKDIVRAYRIPILEVTGFEADDVIGTVAKMARKEGLTTYMLTQDKDYGQLVEEGIYMYRPSFGGGFDILGPDEINAKYSLKDPIQVIDLLALMGDSSDNIPGCKGVGEKTAVKLLQEYGNVETLLERSDSLKGALKTKVEEHKDEIILSKKLATIRTDVPIGFDKEACRRKPENLDELSEIFNRIESKQLLSRIRERLGMKAASEIAAPVAKTRKPAKDDGFAASLFDEPATKSTTAPTPKNGGFTASLFDEIPTDDQENDSVATLAKYDEHIQKYKLIESDSDIDALIQKLLTCEAFALDTETTSTEPMLAELVGLSFAIRENEAYYVPVPSKRQEADRLLDRFRPVYENERNIKIGQNIKFDMVVLSQYGIRIKGQLFDTMIAHYLLQPETRHNMDYLSEIYLHYQTIHIDELIGSGRNQISMRQVPKEKVCIYAAEDADVTLKLKGCLEKEIKENHLEDLMMNIEMPLIRVLAKMESDGVLVDTEALKDISRSYTSQMEEIEHRIHEIAGESFNISSPKQVGEILFDKLKLVAKPKKTKTGQYVTSEEVLQALRNKHEIVEKILDYRGLKKLLSTYIDSLPTLINPRTGRIHTSFNQAVTATGRLSSSNPNLQNIPVRDDLGREIRKAFIPEEGCTFFSADYSQIELRIMAHLSQDKNMVEAFNNGWDIHQATAAKVYKVALEDVTKEMRRKAKTANFGIIYGISIFGLAERMNVERSEAKELIDGYFQTYPNIRAYMDQSIEVAREQGYVTTIFSRKRYLPDINSRNATVRGYAERNAINAPIQGSAADIIKIAMIRIYEAFERLGLRTKMLTQVHDELNFSVPLEERETVEKVVIEEMENAYRMLVPLKADFGWGDNWLEAH